MRLAWATALLLLATLLLGCKQGEGDRCQLDSDCEDDLVCCVDPAHIHEGGICRPTGKCDQNPVDSGPDAPPLEAGPDSLIPDGPIPDGPVSDGPVSDGPSPDKGPTPDVAQADTTPTPDTTPAPDQQISVDTFTPDLAPQG